MSVQVSSSVICLGSPWSYVSTDNFLQDFPRYEQITLNVVFVGNVSTFNVFFSSELLRLLSLSKDNFQRPKDSHQRMSFTESFLNNLSL